MRMHVILSLVIALLLVAGCARGDYLEVRRHALIKTDPVVEAETIREAIIGEFLPLTQDGQTNGYYAVRLEEGSEGWIYRSFVRRFPGDPPAIEPPPSDDPTTPTPPAVNPAVLSPHAYQGVPMSTDPEFPAVLLAKPYFAVGYSEERRNPLWVCYTIGPVIDLTTYRRPSRFAVDHDTETKVTHDDYTHSGFSRGHMAPRFALSSRYGEEANDATFVMSNICPQFQNFNDGQWGDLEEWVAGRKLSASNFIPGWADEYEQVWVTIGPIFDEDRDPLASMVEMPNAYFCLVVDEVEGEPRVLAFIFDHIDERDAVLSEKLTTVDEVERRTGLDFFSRLPDDVEALFEAVQADDLWPLPLNPN